MTFLIDLFISMNINKRKPDFYEITGTNSDQLNVFPFVSIELYEMIEIDCVIKIINT